MSDTTPAPKAKAPREWWIIFSCDPKDDQKERLRYVSGKEPDIAFPEEEAIRVVEYSALQDALAKVEIARKALEFYANTSNWVEVSIHDRPRMCVDDLELTNLYEDTHCRQGGRRARQALAALDGEG